MLLPWRWRSASRRSNLHLRRFQRFLPRPTRTPHVPHVSGVRAAPPRPTQAKFLAEMSLPGHPDHWRDCINNPSTALCLGGSQRFLLQGLRPFPSLRECGPSGHAPSMGIQTQYRPSLQQPLAAARSGVSRQSRWGHFSSTPCALGSRASTRTPISRRHLATRTAAKILSLSGQLTALLPRG